MRQRKNGPFRGRPYRCPYRTDDPAVTIPGLFAGAAVPEQTKAPAIMSFAIQPAMPGDEAAIETLIDASFGEGRRTRTVYRFRDGVAPLPGLTFVARDPDGRTLGSIAFWPVRLPDGKIVPLLGPLAVQPDLRGYGIGRALVTHGLTATRLQGVPAVLIVGDPGYYAPFGFSVPPVAGLALPGPVSPLTFMGLEFKPGTLSTLSGEVSPARD